MASDAELPPYALVQRQAEDEGLWFLDSTATEAYFQRALRELHAAVEDESRAPDADLADAVACLERLRPQLHEACRSLPGHVTRPFSRACTGTRRRSDGPEQP